MSCPWPGEVVGIGDFCEAIHHCSWVLQPLATASALAFIPVAAGTVRLARSAHQPALNLLTVAALGMAVGTVAQHATGSWTGMLIDHAGMELSNVAMAMIGLRRWFGWSWRKLLIGGVVGYALTLLATALWDDLRRFVMIGGMVPCALIELRLWFRDGAETHYRWLGAGWAAFILAVAAWSLDQQPSWCAPDSAFQLHALWHVLAALGLACWALYYSQFPALRPGGSNA